MGLGGGKGGGGGKGKGGKGRGGGGMLGGLGLGGMLGGLPMVGGMFNSGMGAMPGMMGSMGNGFMNGMNPMMNMLNMMMGGGMRGMGQPMFPGMGGMFPQQGQGQGMQGDAGWAKGQRNNGGPTWMDTNGQVHQGQNPNGAGSPYPGQPPQTPVSSQIGAVGQQPQGAMPALGAAPSQPSGGAPSFFAQPNRGGGNPNFGSNAPPTSQQTYGSMAGMTPMAGGGRQSQFFDPRINR